VILFWLPKLNIGPEAFVLDWAEQKERDGVTRKASPEATKK